MRYECSWMVEDSWSGEVRQCAGAVGGTRMWPHTAEQTGIPLCPLHRKGMEKHPPHRPRLSDHEEGFVVYFLLNHHDHQVKIGKSRTPEKRIRSIRTQAGIDFELLGTVPQSIGLVEGGLHREAESLRTIGEWFEATPELLDWIERIVDPKISSSDLTPNP